MWEEDAGVLGLSYEVSLFFFCVESDIWIVHTMIAFLGAGLHGQWFCNKCGVHVSSHSRLGCPQSCASKATSWHLSPRNFLNLKIRSRSFLNPPGVLFFEILHGSGQDLGGLSRYRFDGFFFFCFCYGSQMVPDELYFLGSASVGRSRINLGHV